MINNVRSLKSITFALIGLGLILAIYNVFFIRYALQKHRAFQTAGFDLGNYSQAMWNTVHGYPLAMTTVENITSRWAAHLEPTLLLLTPIYALAPYPQTLLAVQVIIVSAGALPIFLIAYEKLDSGLAGIVYTIIYLLFPALQGAILFDFHGVTLAPPLLSWTLWFVYRQQYRWVLLMALLAMGCKENIPLLILLLGGYIFFVQRQIRWGFIIGGIAALWFLLANFFIIPALSPIGDNIQLGRYGQWGDSLGEVIISLMLNPIGVLQFIFSGDRLNYWIRLTMPVAFTALLNPLVLLIALPEILINTLSAYPPNYQLDRFHYSASIVPFVVVASINGVRHVVNFASSRLRYASSTFVQNALLAMILIVTMVYQVQFGYTPIGNYFEWPQVTEHHRIAHTMFAKIPPNASVAAQNNLAPHLSQRTWIFILPKVSQENISADYVAFDLQGDLIPYDYIEDYCLQLNQFLSNENYGLIFNDDGLLLFKRGVPRTTTSFTPTQPCDF